jgi:hypothetical protein
MEVTARDLKLATDQSNDAAENISGIDLLTGGSVRSDLLRPVRTTYGLCP